MTKDEALKLALSTLDEVRQETFRLMRDGQKLYQWLWVAHYEGFKNGHIAKLKEQNA